LKEILFVSKGLHAASTRYRATDFFPLLEEAGWRPRHLSGSGSLRDRLAVLRAARRAEVVVLVRRTYGPMFRFLLRRAARHLVFTFDDAIFCRSDGGPSPRRARRFAATVAQCDLVWAGNRYLADEAGRFNGNVQVVPTAVETDRYRLRVAKPESTLDLVWIGSSSTRKHLLTVVPALERAAEEMPGLRLKIVSDFTLETRSLPVVHIPWSPEAETRELAAAHVGLAPLPDNRFTRGKCGLKVLQYMAAGLPVVSSPTGVNAEIVEHGVTGLLAETEDEWVEALRALHDSSELRARLGEAGREKCVRHYSLQTVFGGMMKSLDELVQRRAASQ